MKKIPVPTRDNQVDDHFGNCEAYTIFTVNEKNEIEKTEILPSPQGCGCKSNIGSILQENGVSVMLAGNMGDGALRVLHHYEIDVYRGCSGDVSQLVNAFLEGQINDSGEACTSHEHEHTCENHIH